MKFIALFCMLLVFQKIHAQSQDDSVVYASPLVDFSEEWEDEKYSLCNTAADAAYMNDTEKDVIYILNLARQYPVLFYKTVVMKYPGMSCNEKLSQNLYFKSLVAELKKLSPQPLFQADKQCFESAFCHAAYSGKTGYVGHNRTSKQCIQNKYFLGECCDYGNEDALDIVVALLIDRDIKNLSHRKILLGNYNLAGVSIQPHKKYRVNAVIDLH